MSKFSGLVEGCIGCRMCTDECAFLKKYDLTLGDVDKLHELSYHCFLCGKCDSVCPVGIKGSSLLLEMRRDAVHNSGGKVDSAYNMMLLEKRNYKFKNYKHASEGSVLFPGCNFLSLYPKTTDAIAKLWASKYGIGIIYDCCGKPVAELGLENEENSIIKSLQERLDKSGVSEIVTFCPNCKAFLSDRLVGINVISIYQKMLELGINVNDLPDDGALHIPCPDRETRLWLSQITELLGKSPNLIEESQCCGLGGSARAKEPELSEGMSKDIIEKAGGKIYTYCASCAGQLLRSGASYAEHILPILFGINERADSGKSFVNRARSRFK